MGINDEDGDQRIYFRRVGRELKVIDAGRYAREFHVGDFGVLLEEKKRLILLAREIRVRKRVWTFSVPCERLSAGDSARTSLREEDGEPL